MYVISCILKKPFDSTTICDLSAMWSLLKKERKKKEAKKEKHLNMKHDTLAALIYSKEGYESKFIKKLK